MILAVLAVVLLLPVFVVAWVILRMLRGEGRRTGRAGRLERQRVIRERQIVEAMEQHFR